ncbi:hypothetical protein D3C71_1128120 [compost metagenome]
MLRIEFVIRMKRQKRVEHCKRPVLQAQAFSRLADIAKHLPFLYPRIALGISDRKLSFHQGKRHRPPPKRRRDMSRLHFSLTFR